MPYMPPPPYSEKDLYEKPPESTSCDFKLAKTADNPNNSRQIVEEINALVKNGVDLDNCLLKIHSLVVKAGLPSECKAKELRDVYIDLLWRSREIAGNVLGAVKELKGDMLELLVDPDETPQNKMTDLTEMSNVIKSKGAEAHQKQRHEFNGLLKMLSEYSKTVQEEITAGKLNEEAQIGRVQKKITELKATIAELDNSDVDPLSKMQKLMKGGFCGLLSGLPTIACHNLTEAAVHGICELGNYKDILKKKSEERFALQHELEAKINELHDLKNQQAIRGDTPSISGLVAGIRDDIAAFADRLTTFTRVFDQLQNEYDGFVLLLKSNTPVTDPAFKSTVQLKSIAPRIVSALELYSKAQIRER
ncbi:hypothetical protein EDD18DRAFT_1469126 [Armillaria luteobubalina]|uniref:Uncharacterized protein n=1 Tax=Armillaria luteobubalina TaxID=153913 RepID=A0AA39P5M4_9AGAR|nr:hypothetical protein EDD18DRAFT_1469126 [Armillaria luteobubalina]